MPRQRVPWFRCYSDILDNRKARELKPQLFKHWFMLLALANIGNPRGQLPNVQDVAFRLRVSDAEAVRVMNELHSLGFLDMSEGHYWPHDWEEWQPKSDDWLTYQQTKRNPSGTKAETKGKQIVSAVQKSGNPQVEEEREEEKEEERDKEPEEERAAPRPEVGVVARLYENEIGTISGLAREKIIDLVDEYPLACIEGAFAIAVKANKRRLDYVEGICRKHKAQGSCLETISSASVAAVTVPSLRYERLG